MEVGPGELDGPNFVIHCQLRRRMKMHDTPIDSMNVENVEEFEVLIFESRDLEISVISLRAPWMFAMENYEISLQ
jgi:hypothetical protein